MEAKEVITLVRDLGIAAWMLLWFTRTVISKLDEILRLFIAAATREQILSNEVTKVHAEVAEAREELSEKIEKTQRDLQEGIREITGKHIVPSEFRRTGEGGRGEKP